MDAECFSPSYLWRVELFSRKPLTLKHKRKKDKYVTESPMLSPVIVLSDIYARCALLQDKTPVKKDHHQNSPIVSCFETLDKRPAD